MKPSNKRILEIIKQSINPPDDFLAAAHSEDELRKFMVFQTIRNQLLLEEILERLSSVRI